MTADIDHSLFITSEEDKFELLTDITIMENPDSCIIFCSTKDRVDLVWERLKQMNYHTQKLHGGMEQADRSQREGGFAGDSIPGPLCQAD